MAAQWGSELTGVEQSAIDIAVRVSGQQTVTELQQRLADVRREIDFQKAAYHGAAQSLEEFQKEMRTLLPLQAKLEAGARQASNALKGIDHDFRVSGQAGLQLSYALDDLQYGFSAIVNNAPGIAQSLGAGAGVAGALGVAFVAANVLSKALPDLSGEFEVFGKAIKQAPINLDLIRDPIRDATGSIAGMTEVIAALNAKPIKLEVDHDAIRNLTRDLDQASRAVREFDALANKDPKAIGEAKEHINKGIVEGGGPGAIEDALIEIKKRDGTYGAGSQLHGQIAQERAFAHVNSRMVNILGGPSSTAAQPFLALVVRSLGKIADLEQQMDLEAREKIKQAIEMKAGEGGRQVIEGMLLDPRNKEILQRRGVTNEARLGVVMASPWNMKARSKEEVAAQENDRKERVETEKAVEDAVKDAEALSRKIAGEQNRDAEATAHEGKQDRGLEGRIRAKNQREAAAAARKDAAAARKDDANAKRQEREAPKIAEHTRDMGFAQDFQRMTGANNAEANYAGKQIGNLVEKGVEPGVAAQQVYDKMMRVILKMQANQDLLTGINSGAIQQLRMLDARADMTRQQIQGVGNNMRRMGNQRPTRNITFGF